MINIREANGLFLKLTSDVCVGVRLRMWLFLCQQVGPWVTFLSKEERETSVCSVYCETTDLIRAHGRFVECIGLLLLSVASELLFYSTITPYRTVTLLCINLHLYSSFICGLSHSYSIICLPPSSSHHRTLHSFTLECVCVLEQHVPCIFSLMLMSEITCDLNSPDQ